jgi:hypothetical protein
LEHPYGSDINIFDQMFSSQNLALDRLTGFYTHSSSLAREQGKKKSRETYGFLLQCATFYENGVFQPKMYFSSRKVKRYCGFS